MRYITISSGISNVVRSGKDFLAFTSRVKAVGQMSIRRLNGVELVSSPISLCTTCKGIFSSRKLEALYLASPGQRDSVSAYLVTDVWYCKRCDKGYLLSAFKQVVDPYNRKWTIKELAPSIVRHLPTQIKSKTADNPKESNTSPKALRVESIDFILPDHSSSCLFCSMELTKQSIEIKILKGPSVEYIPCWGLHCASCNKWMLRKHHYAALQSNYKPYTIQLTPTSEPKQAHKPKQQAKNSPNKKTGVPKVKGKNLNPVAPSPKNNQFNKYGVFIPSPTNRNGYFDE